MGLTLVCLVIIVTSEGFLVLYSFLDLKIIVNENRVITGICWL